MPFITLPAAIADDKEQLVQLLQRSTVAGVSCVTTWALSQQLPLCTIQASSLQGLVAATIFPAPMAMASFCGSFAGMSAHCTGIPQAAVLASLTAAAYFLWDGNKVQLGKGGRMGTVAFLANVAYLVGRLGLKASLVQQVTSVVNVVRPVTAMAVASSALLLAAANLRIPVTSDKKHTSTTLVKRTVIVKHLSKALILGALVSRLVSSSQSPALSTLTKWLGSSSAMWIASLTVQRLTPVAGVVMATSAVGLLGSLVAGNLSAAIYLGAFVGMTGLKQFTARSAGEASLLSATLLELGLWNGFGGKLGWMAFLGVNFGL